MLIHDECAAEPFGVGRRGETKSSLMRLGPGCRWTRALKCESQTGQLVAGKVSW